jgi:integrase
MANRFLEEQHARIHDFSGISTTLRRPRYVAAIKLLIFTGARLGEILGLRWDWIDCDRGEARLPDSKTGAKTLHLPPPALAVLAELPRVEGNPHVITGKKEGRKERRGGFSQPATALALDPQASRLEGRAPARPAP